VPGLPEPLSHYTDAVRFGSLLFVSGVVSLDEDGRVVAPDGVVAQAHQVHVTLQKVFRAAGADFKDVLKVTVFLTNIEDRQRVNEVRQEFFGSSRPASTLVEVSALVLPELKIEIDAVLGLPDLQRSGP
jgi:reactive intermediate/imine deaminase